MLKSLWMKKGCLFKGGFFGVQNKNPSRFFLETEIR